MSVEQNKYVDSPDLEEITVISSKIVNNLIEFEKNRPDCKISKTGYEKIFSKYKTDLCLLEHERQYTLNTLHWILEKKIYNRYSEQALGRLEFFFKKYNPKPQEIKCLLEDSLKRQYDAINIMGIYRKLVGYQKGEKIVDEFLELINYLKMYALEEKTYNFAELEKARKLTESLIYFDGKIKELSQETHDWMLHEKGYSICNKCSLKRQINVERGGRFPKKKFVTDNY